MKEKPAQIVAENIINRLKEKQLLPEERKEEWIENLSSGTANSQDWNLLSDFYIKKNKTNVDFGSDKDEAKVQIFMSKRKKTNERR